MLRIYGRANSINVRKVLWACGELGIAFEREDWGRGFRSTDEPEFQAVSTFGVIPVIDDSGFILRESNVIVRYLCQREGRSDLFPVDLKERANVEAWMDWSSTDLYQAVRPVFQGLVFKLPQFDDPDIIANGIVEWTSQMKRLESYLGSGPAHIAGAAFTAADIPVGLNVNRWFMSPFEKPGLPAVAAYYERLQQRAPFREHGANGLP